MSLTSESFVGLTEKEEQFNAPEVAGQETYVLPDDVVQIGVALRPADASDSWVMEPEFHVYRETVKLGLKKRFYALLGILSDEDPLVVWHDQQGEHAQDIIEKRIDNFLGEINQKLKEITAAVIRKELDPRDFSILSYPAPFAADLENLIRETRHMAALDEILQESDKGARVAV